VNADRIHLPWCADANAVNERHLLRRMRIAAFRISFFYLRNDPMNIAIILPSKTLYFRENNSDKVYTCEVKAQDDGYIVEMRYGRRGQNMTCGCKTPMPVSLDKAIKVFQQTIAEKERKGYYPGPDGKPYQSTENARRVSGLLPQLLNAIDEPHAQRLVLDDAWCLQPKHDGVRCLAAIAGASVMGINRKGLTVPLPIEVEQALQAMSGLTQAVLDGELIGTTLYVFDILRHDGADVTNLPLGARLVLLDAYPFDGKVIVRTVTYRDASDKREALFALRKSRAEGVVFKRLDAPYLSGRPSSGGTALKLKFTASATARVSRQNPQKRSVGMELLDAAGQWTDVGNVTIPANLAAIPRKGAIIEVTYLYAMPTSHALFQPVLKAIREDQKESDCVTSQLQFKAEAVEA
jgi:bifunctional non-homologous end joining protein LigD